MSESTIVLGLVIIVCFVLICNKRSAKQPCDKQVPYFQNMPDDVPILTSILDGKSYEEHNDGLNDIKTLSHQLRQCSNVGDGSNAMKSRWACYADVIKKNETGGESYDNMDVQMTPTQLHHGLGYNAPKILSGAKYNVKSDGFADDGWLDSDFN